MKLRSLLFQTITLLLMCNISYAETICIKSTGKVGKKSSVTVSTSTKTVATGLPCPKGYKVLLDFNAGPQGPQGQAGPQGVQGQAGAQGAQGQTGQSGEYRIYGDGSKGDLVTTSGVNFITDLNTQYGNITIVSGSTLFIPSGTTLRCLGNFVNNGTLVIQRAAIPSSGVSTSVPFPTTASVFGNQATSGIFSLEATGPSVTEQASGGRGAKGIFMPQSTPGRMIVRPTFLGGGAGGNGSSSGGDGGGFGAVLCQGDIINNVGANIFSQTGTPSSSPGTYIGGGAGAGGGIVILASASSITNSGTIYANGSDGAPAGSAYHSGTATAYGWGAGGGGGGGIVHFISPSISAGTVIVAAGAAGASASPTTYSAATTISINGGGGGGSGYGYGGNGGLVNANLNTKQLSFGSGQVGDVGVTYQTLANPTTLY